MFYTCFTGRYTHPVVKYTHDILVVLLMLYTSNTYYTRIQGGITDCVYGINTTVLLHCIPLVYQ